MVPSRQLLARFLLVPVLGLILSSCGGVPYYEAYDSYHAETRGIYHPVKKGQTLYSIAKAYGVSVKELEQFNGIQDPSELDVGHHLWIPNADRILDVAPTVENLPEASDPPATPKKYARKKRKTKAERKAAAAKRRLMWPVRGGVLTSRFGTRFSRSAYGRDLPRQ